MRANRIQSILVILTLFLLVACSGQQVVVETPIPSVINPEEITPLPTLQLDLPIAAPARCTVTRITPTAAAADDSLFPAVDENDWAFGPTDAALTILEYSELQCPYCADFEPTAVQLQKDYPDDVRLVFRHFPLSIHDKSLLAAQAIEAAGKQDYNKFFELKNRIFDQQETWIQMAPTEFKVWVIQEAVELGLDPEQFEQDLNSQEIYDKVVQAQTDALNIGVPGTPFIIINGSPYQGPRDYASLESILKLFQLERLQYAECPPMIIDTQKEYHATIQTELGDIRIKLYPDQATTAVNNFVFLASEGWYDKVTFHKVLPGFIAQAGDPSGTGYGGPGYAFEDEIRPDLQFDHPGMVAMANSGPDSNGSQFFITYAALENLNGLYTVFGEVEKGMDVVERLSPNDVSLGNNLSEGTMIKTIIIEEE